MNVFKDASAPLMSNKIKTDSKELLSTIKTEEIDNFEESKLEFENLHQVNLCEIKTESCVEKVSSTKSDELIYKENIKTENVNSNEGIQKRKRDIETIPVCTNASHDFLKNRQTVQTIKMYSRKKCYLSTTRKRQLPIGKFDGTCSSCGQFFYDKYLFLNHFYIYHFLVVSKKCVNLRRNNSGTKDINLKDLVNLNEQMTTHSGKKSFKCEICSKCFIHSGNFKRHIRSHSSEKPFECETCLKCFKSSSHLKRHIRIHTDEKPFICKICSKCFRLSGDLKMHIRIHTDEKPFKCEICSKCFTGSGDLKRHKRTHTGEKPFKCEICSKCFIASDALKKHIKIHTNEKPFKCEICLKCFIGSSKLKRHIRTHTGEKPFCCEICSKCFAHNSSLKKHIIRTHTC